MYNGTNLIIQFRHDVGANWTTVNPVLAEGEMGIETDTDLFKIGDGVTAWNSLPYGGLQGPTGPTGFNGTIGATGPTGSVGYYIFDGGIPTSSYVDGPAFNAGGPGFTGVTGPSGMYNGVNLVIQLRHGLAADWAGVNPVLAVGEMALETDTGLFKIGDGTTAWNSLPYGGLQGATGPTGNFAGIITQSLIPDTGTAYDL